MQNNSPKCHYSRINNLGKYAGLTDEQILIYMIDDVI